LGGALPHTRHADFEGLAFVCLRSTYCSYTDLTLPTRARKRTNEPPIGRNYDWERTESGSALDFSDGDAIKLGRASAFRFFRLSELLLIEFGMWRVESDAERTCRCS
jgi:hypothetical protein